MNSIKFNFLSNDAVLVALACAGFTLCVLTLGAISGSNSRESKIYTTCLEKGATIEFCKEITQ